VSMDRARTAIRWQLLALVLLGTLAASAPAADFHVSNKVYFKADDTPVVSTTLFSSGRAYDFMDSPRETIVFDPGHDLIVILDPHRQVKTQITTGEISTQIGRLREAARNHKKETVRELAGAKFAEAIDPKTGDLKLTNRWMIYEVATKPPENPQVARQYAEFADWLTQLNALLNPPELPFPRLALNEVLRQRQEVPLKITRTTMSEQRRRKPLVVHSEHTFVVALSHEDQQRMQEAHDQMHMFAEVTFDKYHQAKQEAETAAEESLKRAAAEGNAKR